MTIIASHEGYDPMGGLTTHRGMLETCPAPECQDRIAEQQEARGTYCPHGKKITEPDPDHPDPDGQPERIVSPWPCTKDGCTLEAFEQREKEREQEYYEALNQIAADVYR